MKKFLALALAVLMVMAVCAGCGDKAEETTETATAAEAPAAAAGEGAAPAEDGQASGEMGGMGNQSTDFEVTVNGVTGTAHYEDVDDNNEETKSFVITWDGSDIAGAIDKGVWTATSGDAADQAVVDAVHEAFEANNGGSMGPSDEPAA